MDLIAEMHQALGTDSIGFVFQAMASIAFTYAVWHAGKVALKMHRDRAAVRVNQELEAEEQALQAKIDAIEWDPEKDYSHRVDLVKRGQWLGK